MQLRNVVLAAACALGGGRSLRQDGRARILMFHGTPHRLAGRLERLLRYVRRHFEVVPLERLAAAPRLHNRVALTFDDGLRSNVQVAYPILRRLSLPATFFVCPQLVDEAGWIWTHAVRAQMRREGIVEDEIDARVERMKAEPRRSHLSPPPAPTEEERESHDLAGWEELRALDPRLIEIGSHTLTHPILTTLDPAEAEREIARSRTLLEERLGRPVRSFAYPNGGVDAAVRDCVARHYSVAVATHTGFVAPGDDPFLLRRLPVSWNPLRFALALHRERREDYFFVTPSTTSGSQVAI